MDMPFVKDPETGKPVFLGAFWFFLGDERIEPADPLGRSFLRIRPPLLTTGRSGTEERGGVGSIGSISSSRTLELWKEPVSDKVEIVATTSPQDAEVFAREWASAYHGCRVESCDRSEPAWVSHASSLLAAPQQDQDKALWFFDAEQTHALPGCWFDTEQPRTLVDALIRALKGRGRAGWIQFAWADFDWTHYLEAASMILQAKVEEIERGREVTVPRFNPAGLTGLLGGGGSPISMERKTVPHEAAGSTIHVHGRAIAKEYFEKAQHPPLILSLRGMVIGDKHTPDHLQGALSTVKISYDYLGLFHYPTARMIRWLRKRDIPNPAKMLELHARGGFLYDWGKGRELIPALCLTPEELPALVHLPSDPGLLGVVDYTRASGLPIGSEEAGKEKVGPALWR